MIEPKDFSSVLSLYQGCFPLLLAVIRGKQRGQIFANDDSAVVINNFGFMGFFGDEHNEAFNIDLVELFAGDAIKPNYLLWYSPPVYWQKRLGSRRERVRFKLNSLGEMMQCPVGFELRKLDADLIPRTAEFGMDIDSRFWSSAADFCEYGFGVCLIKDSEVVGVCYSACVVDGLAEIDIVVQEKYRGRGLGIVMGQGFIKECMRRGIAPTWDCFTYNTASVQLAERLGFIKQQTYPFYSFNIPLELR